ncbi:hypothetical protein L210DRAFT_3646942 [Boletus edulis BED1]|uniref:Uncharacterized protein n=1 Tax=Boletus edulis BED1 TaxID=1328754 RepID=A0AAD4GD26_BOLED|nr:hypothetical protein L210DRAFT_3646942 [Boletus edulis BED1]
MQRRPTTSETDSAKRRRRSDSRRYACYRRVAEQQFEETLVVVLPVYTREEHDLFRLLVHSSPLFSDIATRQPNRTSLAAVWATHWHGNGKAIFTRCEISRLRLPSSQADLVITPQLPEHLQVYCKIWNDYCNKSNTIALNTDAANCIRTLLCLRLLDLNLTAPMALPMTLRDTLAAPNPSTTLQNFSPWQKVGDLLDHHTLQQSALPIEPRRLTTTASRAPLSVTRWSGSAHSDSSALPPVLQHDMQQPRKKARCTQINPQAQGSHSMMS